jgi:hypothetical protein
MSHSRFSTGKLAYRQSHLSKLPYSILKMGDLDTRLRDTLFGSLQQRIKLNSIASHATLPIRPQQDRNYWRTIKRLPAKSATRCNPSGGNLWLSVNSSEVPSPLPVRQYRFDKYWSMPFRYALKSIKKIRTAKCRMKNVECRTAEPQNVE